jgi:hypothetical protein
MKVHFTVTGKGQIEVSASSSGNFWLIQISRDGEIRRLRNMKEVKEFPRTPITRKVNAAATAIHPQAVAYLERCWEQNPPRPIDDQPGRLAWWEMKQKVESF